MEHSDKPSDGTQPQAAPIKSNVPDFAQSFTSVETTPNFNKGNNMSATSLVNLLASTNLISAAHTAPEVAEIVKMIDEKVKEYQKNTASELQKATLPRFQQSLTSDISPNLPGIAMFTVLGSTAYVMPVLFYKAGITDVTETITLDNQPPRGYAKAPLSFMSIDLIRKVKEAFSHDPAGKKLDDVKISSPCVINLERYLKKGHTQEQLVNHVGHTLMKEWMNGLVNMGFMEAIASKVTIPNPFAGAKLFGAHEAAIARVESVHQLDIDGCSTPWNLVVKLATTGKNGQANYNNQNAKTIQSTYLNVQLEGMTEQQFVTAHAKNPSGRHGPLVPVISVGTSIPGETLHHNNSMMSELLGVFASLAANQLQYTSEAFRGKEVGHRGNLSVFNHYLSTILRGNYTNAQHLTEKNITSVKDVNQWIQTYVAPTAVYALDLCAFSKSASNVDFWYGMAKDQGRNIYGRAAVSLMDLLSGGKFSDLIAANQEKGAARDLRKDWLPGDGILALTPHIRPVGHMTVGGRDIDLGEVDGMFLRQAEFYGTNEVAIAEYNALLSGAMLGSDLRARQFNIQNRLNMLANNNVIIEGYANRFLFNEAFMNTVHQAMSGAGTMAVSGNNGATSWTHQYQNDLLTMTLSASLGNGGSILMGQTGQMFTHY